MPYSILHSERGLVLELRGTVTARDASELGQALAAALPRGAAAIIRAPQLEDIDTCILQLLIALRRTASEFQIESPSEAFIRAIDRSALRRELLAGSREAA